MTSVGTENAQGGREPAIRAARAPTSPGRPETVGVLVLLIALFGFNLVTYNYYPAVWCDDVSFSEPAINFVKYGSFTTLVWQYQPPNTFPALNCPLYAMSLAPWLAVTGTSLLAVRSFNYALLAIAAFLAWQVSWRFALLKSAFGRLTLVLLLHLGYGITHAYRSSRPDVLGMISLLLLVLAFKIERPRPRAVCLVVLSVLTVWIGLQVALYACFAWFLCWAILRWPLERGIYAASTGDLPGAPDYNQARGPADPVKRDRCCAPADFLRELCLFGCGFSLGAITLAVFMYSKGVLREFLACTTGMFVVGMRSAGSAAGSFPHTVRDFVHTVVVNYFADFSAAVIMMGLALLLALYGKRLAPATRRFAVFSLALFFGVPALFTLVGHYGFYYSYMVFGPALLALLAACAELGVFSPGTEIQQNADPRTRRPRSYAVASAIGFGALFGAAALGLPMRLAVAFSTSKLAPRSELQRIVSSQIRSDDVVMTDYRGFFEAKQVARNVYDPWSSYGLMSAARPGHEFSVEEKAKFTALIIPTQEKVAYFDFFGGQWSATCEPFGDTQDFNRLTRLPIIGRRFASYAAQPQVARRQLQVFRRSKSAAGD